MEYYENDKGEVGVLIARYEGWSTMSIPEIAYDKRIIETFLNDPNKVLFGNGTLMACYMADILGYRDISCSAICGARYLSLEFVPKGKEFMIERNWGDEGGEYIVYKDKQNWICFLEESKVDEQETTVKESKTISLKDLFYGFQGNV